MPARNKILVFILFAAFVEIVVVAEGVEELVGEGEKLEVADGVAEVLVEIDLVEVDVGLSGKVLVTTAETERILPTREQRPTRFRIAAPLWVAVCVTKVSQSWTSASKA
jgi:hypothetical protein